MRNYPFADFPNGLLLLLFCFCLLNYNCKKPEYEAIGTPGGIPGIVLHMDKPNIILILGEEMGYEVPTVNGGGSYSTPNLDKLAQTGMRFTGCHGTPLCAPSRVMLMTGKYNYRNYDFYGRLNTDQRTFANMLKDAGYETAIYGKWEMDGGDASIRLFGFDHYAIWNPFKDLPGTDHGSKGSHYKNPIIYHNGDYIDSALTIGKYGDDIFTDSVKSFMELNINKPFFAYYPMTLSHGPSSPTPDDPEYANWNPFDHIDDSRFFPSMVKYADKKVGEIIDKVNELKIQNETIVIVIFGDNGTREGINSIFNGVMVAGGRLNPTELGTHVPLFVYWAGITPAGSVNEDLINFTDFLPTLADIANVPKPATFGILDGQSFYHQMRGEEGNPRSWIFCHYQPFLNVEGNTKLFRWAQTKEYKLYDSNSTKLPGKFINIVKDVDERQPLNIGSLNPAQKDTLNLLKSVLASHK